MSIIALSYHVFHAKTSRHVSYLRNGTVDPKAATSKLFNHVTFSTDMGNEYQNTTVHIYVTAEAVQTANLDKYGPIDVWKHVGTVEASTSSTQIDPIPTA